MNNSPHDPRGPPPPHPPHPPQGFMQPHNPRINPRMAGPNSAIGGGGLQDPRMGPGAHAPPPPPLLAPPRPLQATASATDAITAVLASMTQQNVYDVISSMKALTATDPDRAVSLLAANPQLSHALVQAMLMNNMVDPISLQKRSASVHLPPQPPAPPVPPMLAAPPVPPTPPTFHQTAPAIPQPVLEQQQQLLQQVMALTPADIASLPEDQRVNILQLRAQLMGAS